MFFILHTLSSRQPFSVDIHGETTNVLLLGMSYTNMNRAIDNSIRVQYKKKNYRSRSSWEKIRHERELKRLVKPQLFNVIDLVKKKIITEMDGRDQARINTIEANGSYKVFTLSLNSNHHYHKKRHCCTDFSKTKGFIDDVRKLCGLNALCQVREKFVPRLHDILHRL